MNNTGDIHSEEWQINAFVGENAEFYKNKWKEHPAKYYKGWNWVPFFFCIEWMAYRKMYVEAFIALLATIGINLFFNIFFPSSLRWGDTIRILGAIIGNALYYMKFIRALKKSSSMTRINQEKYLQERGGISIIALLIAIGFEIIIVFFI